MVKNQESNGLITNTPTTGMDGSADIPANVGDDNDDKNNGIKVPNNVLTDIVNEVPKQEIVNKVLDHLGLKDEKMYDLDIYL